MRPTAAPGSLPSRRRGDHDPISTWRTPFGAAPNTGFTDAAWG